MRLTSEPISKRRVIAAEVALVASAVLLLLVGSGTVGAQEQDDLPGQINVDIFSSDNLIGSSVDEATTWEFELTSPQPGCSNLTELTGDGSLFVFDVVRFDTAGVSCEYTLTEVNVPARFIAPEPLTFTFGRRLDIFLVISNIDPAARGTIPVWITIGSLIPFDALRTLDLELSSEQPGCTNRTVAVSNIEGQRRTLLDDQVAPQFEATVEREIRNVVLAADDGLPCRYELAIVDLPAEFTATGVQEAIFDRPPSGFDTRMFFFVDSADAPAAIELDFNINGDEAELPERVDFVLASSQPGCSNDRLSVSFADGEPQRSIFFQDVVANDEAGEPCGYEVTAVDLPAEWYEHVAQAVDMSRPLRGVGNVTLSHLATARGRVSLDVSSSGDAALAPPNWQYEITSTCLNEPLIVQLPSSTTFLDFGYSDVEVPVFDTDGSPCSFAIEAPAGTPAIPTVTLDPESPYPRIAHNIVLGGDDTSYPSIPVDPTPTAVVVSVSVPVAPAVVAPAPVAAIAPVVAPTSVVSTVVSAETYGFSSTLPSSAASDKQAALAVTGSDAASPVRVAAMLMLAGLVFVAVSKAPRRQHD